MRKRVLFVSLAVTLVGILLISLLFTDLFYKDTVRSAEKQLKIYMGFFDEEAVLGGQGAAQLSEKLGGGINGNVLTRKLNRYEKELSNMGVKFTCSRTGKRRELRIVYDGNDDMTVETVCGKEPSQRPQPLATA